MLINFLSVGNRGDYTVYEVAPSEKQKDYGSFVICSVAHGDFEPQADITGEIKGAAIALYAKGKLLPYQLQLGNKSINQLRIWQIGCHIPHTVALDFSLFDMFKHEGKVDIQDLYDMIIIPRLGVSVAIRSSSNLEDGETQSFAGTFDTYLNIPNQLDDIQKKIAQSYQKSLLKSKGMGEVLNHNIRISIMVQQMVQPALSGFLFTLDPVNPPSDLLKIEFWTGPREKVKGYSIALNRETGKQVLSESDDKKASLPISIQEKLYYAAVKLEHHFGTPQDIEFLVSDENDSLFLVQSRPITAFSYSPDKVRDNEQRKLFFILEENRRLYNQDPILSGTNILELFNRAIPLGNSIFKYGFAGTEELEGGISIGRTKLGYARLDPKDAVNLFYTVADQARTNLVVDALTFRLPGISKQDYLEFFVRHYLEQIKRDPATASYPEDGLYLQTVDSERWFEIAGVQGLRFRTEFSEFLDLIIRVHAPREYNNAGKFFQRNDRLYRFYLNHDLHKTSVENLRKNINNILFYLRTEFCPQYVIYARLAFLCMHVAKVRLDKLLESQSRFNSEQVLNELLREVTIPDNLAMPNYSEFVRLYKLGRVSLAEFLYRFQHLGSLDISKPRLGEYSIEKLIEVLGQDIAYGFESGMTATDEKSIVEFDIEKLGLKKDLEFELFYTNGGQFMLLRENAKGELLKLLWVLKCMLIEFAQRNFLDEDLLYYLELDEIFAAGSEKHKELRMLALQRKAYLDACREHRVKHVLLNLQAVPFEEKLFFGNRGEVGSTKIVKGKSIFYGRAEGYCLTASSNEEFIDKLASYREKNIDNIIGIFKGIEPSYFNVSALAGFATESGGYLSHAATIAREFRLPYITDIGFDQFHDKDYVILDTENEQMIVRQ